MDSIVRGIVVYLFLLVVFRIAGKRTLNEMTAFDFVLLLIISEAVQQALINNDDSLTNALLVVITLVSVDVLLSLAGHRWKGLERLMTGIPVILIDRGKPKQEQMDRERVSEEEILASAREQEGLRRLDEIDYAVLETGGRISIVPKEKK